MRFLARFSLHAFSRRASVVYLGLPLLIGLAIWVSGMGGALDGSLKYWRDGWREHPASGQIAIVEIDAFSTREMKEWPFPRRHHGALVDRLRGAGVHSIAFDVDFSSVSEPREDIAFARALERSGGAVILPAFRQAAGAGRTEFSENLPIDMLRDHAFLGSVNVRPDLDGDMTRQLYGVMVDGAARPSLAATIAEVPGDIDESFVLDLAIDPATIPRFSFADILSGRFDPRALTGKRVIVGATAIELGDRYALPRHGVIPGVVMQAIAAETLLNGVTPNLGALPLFLIGCLVVLFSLRRSHGVAMLLLGAGAVLGTFVLPLATEIAGLATFPVVPALGLILAAMTLRVAGNIIASLRTARFVDNATDLPNSRAFVRDHGAYSSNAVIAMRIANFADLISPLPAGDIAHLVKLIVARIQLVNDGSAVYRVQPDMLAWHGPSESLGSIEDALHGLGQLLRSRITVGGGELVVKANFGVVEPQPDEAADDLLKNAAHAARDAAENQLPLRRYGAELAERSATHQSLLAALDQALAKGDMHLVYQPKHRLNDGGFIGAEALVRWEDGERGMVSPEIFVPIIEREGWEDQLTMLVLDLALADIANWAQRGFFPRIALNFSASLIGDESFSAAFMARLSGADLQPGQIGIEVTETALLSNPESAVATLEKFRALGCKISIDDYGTGQSTLTYLQRLPTDEIKIDQSFIRNMTTREGDRIMVRSTIDMAHQLGLAVIAEGIEDAATAALLDRMGCDIGQGWFYSKPLTSTAIEDYVASAPAATDMQVAGSAN